MSKRLGFLSFVIVIGLVACSGNQGKGNKQPDSVLNDSSKVDSVNEDSVEIQTAGIDNVESLLPELPLLKFPLIVEIDSFEKKEGIPLTLDKNLPWFADFLEFPAGTKISALGKYYLNTRVQAVLFFTSAPNDYPERPDDVELILSIFNLEAGTVDSRILSISSSEAYGNTIMKTPDKGKSFVHQEAAEINITLQDFSISKGEFVLGESVDSTFTGDQQGHEKCDSVIYNWMK